ncbi:hypothetical protein K8I31_17590, partial [bacterium]|nr:hypothetical protein [bacterium]
MKSQLSILLFLFLFLMPSTIVCGVEVKSIEQRILDRMFPSIFMAWSPADGLEGLSKFQNLAKHDLVFTGSYGVKLQWNNQFIGLADGFTTESIKDALALRSELRRLNPNQIVLLEIRYRDAFKQYLPEKHEWWKRDGNGNRVVGWEEGGYFILDFANPSFQAQVAKQAKAAVDSGAVDGVMLDWWIDDEDRLSLVQTIRNIMGEDALILVNANDRQTPKTAKYVNGFFMECWRSKTPEDWRRIAETLLWAESNLRKPHVNCLETWYENSRADLNRMRATTCLVLTHSDGYALFSDPNDLPTSDHQHDWYRFWETKLGRPLANGTIHESGWARRKFEHGTAIYNPMG